MLLPPCPHLPEPRVAMDWRSFNDHGTNRGPSFYGTALEYGHFLWRQGRVARAILCLDRAMGADVADRDTVARSWPMPYAAMAWFLAHTPPDVFTGNPRVHFQHYADRLKEPRREVRQARAWACWHLTRVVRPDLPNDPRHDVTEPTVEAVGRALDQHGLQGERRIWEAVLGTCRERFAP